MTREEALKILKDCRRRGFDRTTYYVEEYHTARDMAIRALEEQETVTEFAERCRECGREKVLDKISAEIDQKQYDFMSDGDYDEGIRFGLMLAYQIIDKYKAESEKL